MRRSCSRLGAWGLPLLLLAGCGGGEDALARGDRLWADSSYTEAIAEYRLAAARGGGEAAGRRLAHAYAVTGQLERAQESWAGLLASDDAWTDQAVYDYLLVARAARRRGDGYSMARAAEAALELRPGLELGDLADAVAAYYADNAASEQALAYYERALANAPSDSAAAILFRIGRLRAEQNACAAALPYLRAYLARAPDGDDVPDARWHIGNCSFREAQDAHQAGNLTAALPLLRTVTSLGVPSNLQDQAWFMSGDILYALGRADEALRAYQRVLDLNPSRNGALVERAQRQIDRIRFGE